MLSKALEALERVASTAAGTSDVADVARRALLEANQPEAAERVLQQATDRYPVDPQAFLAYADVAERQDHPAAARAALIGYNSLVGIDGTFIARDDGIGQLAATGRPGGGQCLVSTRWTRRPAVLVSWSRLSMRWSISGYTPLWRLHFGSRVVHGQQFTVDRSLTSTPAFAPVNCQLSTTPK
jgi:hypothetical protein